MAEAETVRSEKTEKAKAATAPVLDQRSSNGTRASKNVVAASSARDHGVQPPGPHGNYGVRNLLGFARNNLGWLRGLKDTYGDVVQMRVLGSEWFLISHPDDIETVLVKNARIMGRDEYTVVLQRVLGLGLLTSDNELWKKQRRLMSTAFTPKRIRDYGAAMVEVTDRALAPWGEDRVLNLHEEMSRVTMEVVADVLFGASVDARDVESVRHAMESINAFLANSLEAALRIPAWIPTPMNRRLAAAVEAIDSVLYGIIGRRRAGKEERDDLLGTLLGATDEDGTRMDDKQLRDEAVTLFLAGHETTALALAHTLYLLSKHPEIERRVVAELDEVLGGRLPTADDARRLTFTDRVLKESMRLYPPAWTTGRHATEGFEIGDFSIPKGAQILLSQWVVHRDPRWFPNPEGFDPDRWAPERSKDLPKFAYFPFGGGPRVCIGNHFAMMEATLLLATILQRYKVELLPGERLELSPAVTLRQKGPGLKVRVRQRAARSSTAPGSSERATGA